MVDRESLEEAIDQTIIEIREACVLQFDGVSVTVEVEMAAEGVWRERYSTSFAKVFKPDLWPRQRPFVMERAKHVGRIAALMAGVRATVNEMLRSGAGAIPGQSVWVEPVRRPRVNGMIAERAARYIDCERDDHLSIEWIFCDGAYVKPSVEKTLLDIHAEAVAEQTLASKKLGSRKSR